VSEFHTPFFMSLPWEERQRQIRAKAARCCLFRSYEQAHELVVQYESRWVRALPGRELKWPEQVLRA
jgi:hypothetical protein